MTSPTVSLVVPSFNHAAYLDECLASVCNQDYPALEVIVVDGGSTDGSVDIVRRYSSRLAFWRSRSDAGQTHALMEGFSRATGSLLGWVNSDDVLFPGAIASLVATHAGDPGIGLIGGRYVLIDEHGQVIRCKIHPAMTRFFASHGLQVINQPGSLFSRVAYDAVNGLDPHLDYVMDTDLYIRIVLAGFGAISTHQWVAGFRLHASNKSRMTDRQRAEMEYMIGRVPGTHSGTLSRLLANQTYRGRQILSGNYLRMWQATRHSRGRHWRDWAQQLGATS